MTTSSRNPLLNRPAWHIDSATGNDANSGLDASNRIATLREFCRRVAPYGRYELTVDTDVNIYSDTPTTDFFTFDLCPVANAALRIHGVPTSQTFTTNAVTNMNPATPVMPTVSAVGLGTTHVGKLLKTTTGTRYAWAMANPSGTILRTSNFVTVTPGSLSQSAGNPVNAETLTVYTLPVLSAGDVRFYNNNNSSFYFELLQLGDAAQRFRITSSLNRAVYTANCRLHSINMGGDYKQFQNSNPLLLGSSLINAGMYPSLYAGGLLSGGTLTFAESAGAYIDDDFLVEGNIVSGRNGSGSNAIIVADGMALFAQAGHAIYLTAGSALLNQTLSSNTKRIWGTSNTYAIKGDKGVRIKYVAGSKPTASGTSGDMLLGGTPALSTGLPYTWSGAPFQDPDYDVRVEEW